MKKHRLAFCPKCKRFHLLQITSEEAYITINGHEIAFDEKWLYCHKKDYLFMTNGLMEENLWRAHRACEFVEAQIEKSETSSK